MSDFKSKYAMKRARGDQMYGGSSSGGNGCCANARDITLPKQDRYWWGEKKPDRKEHEFSDSLDD